MIDSNIIQMKIIINWKISKFYNFDYEISLWIKIWYEFKYHDIKSDFVSNFIQFFIDDQNYNQKNFDNSKIVKIIDISIAET